MIIIDEQPSSWNYTIWLWFSYWSRWQGQSKNSENFSGPLFVLCYIKSMWGVHQFSECPLIPDTGTLLGPLPKTKEDSVKQDFLKNKYLFLCVSLCQYICRSVYTLSSQKRALDPGPKDTGGCEPPHKCGCWKLSSSPLEEQQVSMPISHSSSTKISFLAVARSRVDTLAPSWPQKFSLH